MNGEDAFKNYPMGFLGVEDDGIATTETELPPLREGARSRVALP